MASVIARVMDYGRIPTFMSVLGGLPNGLEALGAIMVVPFPGMVGTIQVTGDLLGVTVDIPLSAMVAMDGDFMVISD
jgi:hypothetical protein